MTRRGMPPVAAIAVLAIVGSALLLGGGPECGCSRPAASIQQGVDGGEQTLKPSESASERRPASPQQAPPAQETLPLLELKEVKLAHGVAQAVAIYRPNGKPLAILIKAARGAIVCAHFSLDVLEAHGVPAASVQGIRSIEELLETQVAGVNKLASALNVQPGMPVREALEKMGDAHASPEEGAEDYSVSAASAPFARRAPGPSVHVQNIVGSQGRAVAVAIYRPNGKILGLLIKAARGAIVCGHFSLDALEAHGVPAASVQKIDTFEKLAEKNIVSVNALASALGVRPGMSVQQALEQMREGGQLLHGVKEDYARPPGAASQNTQ